MTVHATKVDRSRTTGNLVVCTCGFALGPFMDAAKARKVAEEHRDLCRLPKVSTPESRARANEKARLSRIARKLRDDAEA